LVWAAVSALPHPARAQSEATTEDIILGAWSDPAKCNRIVAEHLQFEEVVKSGTTLQGKCVAVEGFWLDRALFGRRADANVRGSNLDPALQHNRIGIYAREEMLEHAPKRGTHYMVVGVIGECETEWPDAVMVMGYCHYTSGPIILVAEAIVTPARKVR
jgi:hypothetical protein